MLNVAVPFVSRAHDRLFILVTDSGNAVARSPKGGLYEMPPSDASQGKNGGRGLWSAKQIEEYMERDSMSYRIINAVASPVVEDYEPRLDSAMDEFRNNLEMAAAEDSAYMTTCHGDYGMAKIAEKYDVKAEDVWERSRLVERL